MTQFVEDKPKRLRKMSQEEHEKENMEIFESRLKYAFNEDSSDMPVVNDDENNPEEEIEAAIKNMSDKTGSKLDAFVRELDESSNDTYKEDDIGDDFDDNIENDGEFVTSDDIGNDDDDIGDDFEDFEDDETDIDAVEDLDDEVKKDTGIDRTAWPIDFLTPRYSDVDLDEGFESTKDAGKIVSFSRFSPRMNFVDITNKDTPVTAEYDSDVQSEETFEESVADEKIDEKIDTDNPVLTDTEIQVEEKTVEVEPELHKKAGKKGFFQKIKGLFHKNSVVCPYCDARITTDDQRVTCPICSGIFTVDDNKVITGYDAVNIERAMSVRKEYQRNTRYLKLLGGVLAVLVCIIIVLLVMSFK